MTIDKIIVIIISLLGISFTYWFFLMKKEKEVVVRSDAVDITVDGGYQPDFITIPKDKTTRLNFTRRDPATCLEEVVLADFKIRKYLPLNKTLTVELTPDKAGEFDFSCGMGMFHGKLKVSS